MSAVDTMDHVFLCQRSSVTFKFEKLTVTKRN